MVLRLRLMTRVPLKYHRMESWRRCRHVPALLFSGSEHPTTAWSFAKISAGGSKGLKTSLRRSRKDSPLSPCHRSHAVPRAARDEISTPACAPHRNRTWPGRDGPTHLILPHLATLSILAVEWFHRFGCSFLCSRCWGLGLRQPHGSLSRG